MFKTSFFFDKVLEMGFDCTIPFVLVFLEASDQMSSCLTDIAGSASSWTRNFINHSTSKFLFNRIFFCFRFMLNTRGYS